ncbi:uncharacterized protein EI90DRAFT_2020076 [Cantharellus anzutake]|uniref:uncharacterized protein n=1 Tax=Cantharellus anzutake TaxID=1750568 RepID=UPI001904AC73|nr:uncharacterized protein EI90DRAFT_2020076 [Cantharellus anzutake]KAF8325814.1 hypothetical protein EI90DRAFT_2020076 [Cantharellus anzutake]
MKRERDGVAVFPTTANTLVRTHSHTTSDTSPERGLNPSVSNGVVRPRLRLPSDAGTIIPDRASFATEPNEDSGSMDGSNRSPTSRKSLTLSASTRVSNYDSHEDGSDDNPLPRTPVAGSMRHRRQGNVPPALFARPRGRRRNGGGTAPSTPIVPTHRNEVALPAVSRDWM